jgi:nucleotide-binding universal stress UspA family protein
MIVVGSHGSVLAKQMLKGGTAMAVLRRAEVPVLVYRLNRRNKTDQH